jgi:hypothetical protein
MVMQDLATGSSSSGHGRAPTAIKQEEHFLSSPSFFFPLLSRHPTGALAMDPLPTATLAVWTAGVAPTCGLSRPLFERIMRPASSGETVGADVFREYGMHGICTSVSPTVSADFRRS